MSDDGFPDWAPASADKVNPLVGARHDSRAFDSERPISKEVIRRLLEAARWAPSHFNEQPWAFAVATEEAPEFLARARRSLLESDAWARQAPAFIFVLSRKKYSRAHWFMPNHLHLFETGMATARMAVQAADEGLVLHLMQGFYGWQIRRLFRVPRHYVLAGAIAIGYPGDACALPSHARNEAKDEQLRHPQESFAYFNVAMAE